MRIDKFSFAKFSLAILTALFVSLFATSAFAEFEVRMGVSAGLLDWSNDINGWGDPLAGVSGNIELGYSWSGFGIYLSQDIAGLWWTGATGDDMAMIGKDYARFLGGTYLMFRGQFGKIIMFDFGIGLGAMYSGSGDDDAAGIDYALLIPKTSEHDNTPVQFATKMSLGVSFRVTKKFLMGLHLDYAIGFAKLSYSSHDGWGSHDRWETHYLMPGIHFQFSL